MHIEVVGKRYKVVLPENNVLDQPISERFFKVLTDIESVEEGEVTAVVLPNGYNLEKIDA